MCVCMTGWEVNVIWVGRDKREEGATVCAITVRGTGNSVC